LGLLGLVRKVLELDAQIHGHDVDAGGNRQRYRSEVQNSGMVQILGFSGNSTDRPHASTVEVLSVVGPMAGSGTLVTVKAQYV